MPWFLSGVAQLADATPERPTSQLIAASLSISDAATHPRQESSSSNQLSTMADIAT